MPSNLKYVKRNNFSTALLGTFCLLRGGISNLLKRNNFSTALLDTLCLLRGRLQLIIGYFYMNLQFFFSRHC